MPVIVSCDNVLCQRFDAMRVYEDRYYLPKNFWRQKQEDGSYKYFCDPCIKMYQQEQRANRVKS